MVRITPMIAWLLCAPLLLIRGEYPVADEPFLQARLTHHPYSESIAGAETISLRLSPTARPQIVTESQLAQFTESDWTLRSVSSLRPTPVADPPSGYATHLSIVGPNQRQAAGGADGLFERGLNDTWQKLAVSDGQGRIWGTQDVRAITYDAAGRLWFGILAGLGRRDADGTWSFFTGADGLPYNQFTCAAAGPDGSVWFGTTKGAIHYREGEWHYRQGRRWLIDDEVLALEVDPHGTVWLACRTGLTQIEFVPTTLAEKAKHYEAEVATLIKRTPFGYVSPVTLVSPGQRDAVRRHDNDNDGLWTSMYGAGQCFAYAVTQDPQTKERARAAFEALRFLQVVTEGGTHDPPRGYVARTIRSTELPDPNEGRVERDRQRQATEDQLWKVY